jgi:hypothetical protein
VSGFSQSSSELEKLAMAHPYALKILLLHSNGTFQALSSGGLDVGLLQDLARSYTSKNRRKQ